MMIFAFPAGQGPPSFDLRTCPHCGGRDCSGCKVYIFQRWNTMVRGSFAALFPAGFKPNLDPHAWFMAN